MWAGHAGAAPEERTRTQAAPSGLTLLPSSQSSSPSSSPPCAGEAKWGGKGRGSSIPTAGEPTALQGDTVVSSPPAPAKPHGKPEAGWLSPPLSWTKLGSAGRHHQDSPLTQRHPPAVAAAPRPSGGGCGQIFGGEGSHHRSRGGENGLRLFGFYQPLLDQAAIEFLNVCVHTLPIRLAHPDHVLHVQQLRTVCVRPGGRERGASQ